MTQGEFPIELPHKQVQETDRRHRTEDEEKSESDIGEDRIIDAIIKRPGKRGLKKQVCTVKGKEESAPQVPFARIRQQ